jgi:hypothetical protein
MKPSIITPITYAPLYPQILKYPGGHRRENLDFELIFL